MGQVRLVGGRRVVARGGVRGGKDEPADARQPRGVEQAEGLGDVRLERPERVGDGIRDPGTGGEVDDGIGAVDGARDCRRVRQGRLDQLVGDPFEVGPAAD